MNIYRIQDQFGRGPWRPGFSHNWVEDRPDHDNLMSFIDEFGMGIFDGVPDGYHFGCGCKTIEQLQRWISPLEYRLLKGYGYKAVILKVDIIVAESDIQTVFARRKPLKHHLKIVKLYP